MTKSIPKEKDKNSPMGFLSESSGTSPANEEQLGTNPSKHFCSGTDKLLHQRHLGKDRRQRPIHETHKSSPMKHHHYDLGLERVPFHV